MLFTVPNMKNATPSRTSIDISLLQTQGDSAVPDTKVFIVQTANSFLAVIEAQGRERGGLVKAYEQRYTCRYTVIHPLSLPRKALWISTLTQLNRQLSNFQNSLIFIYSEIQYIIGVMSFH